MRGKFMSKYIMMCHIIACVLGVVTSEAAIAGYSVGRNLKTRRPAPKRLVDGRQLLTVSPLPSATQCQTVKIVIGIMSIDKDQAKRQWVRDTYKQYNNVYHAKYRPNGTVAVVFVLGQPPNNTRNAGLLYDEWEEHKDLVFLDIPENMNEGKSYTWLVKAWELYGNCPSLKFIAKGDQDTYIRTHKLESKWMSLPYNNIYYGWTVNVSSSYNGRDFNYSFAVGMLYGLSPSLVQHISSSSIAMQEKAGAEDMKTGYWLAAGAVPVRMVHDESFHDWTKTKDDGQDWAWKPVSSFSTVVHHVYTQQEFKTLWSMWGNDTAKAFANTDWWGLNGQAATSA